MAKSKSDCAVLEVKKFRVNLEALTPLTFNDQVFTADNADDAWEQFCKLNNISGSSCDRTITEVKE